MTNVMRGCPICGEPPQLIKGMRDRDLHPDLPWLQYACLNNRDGHVVKSAVAHAPYLNWTWDTPELMEMARAAWNEERNETQWMKPPAEQHGLL